MKKRRGRKPTGRKAIIYARVTTTNARWFKKLCKQEEKSVSEMLDEFFSVKRLKAAA